jgi:hypothetical protein
MTEKKTFRVNGPLGYGLNYENDFHEWRLYGVETVFEDGVNAFPTDEWDMEVTFTKKPGPVEVGQWREMGKPGEESCVYIVAIHGLAAWVTDDPEWLYDGKLNAWTEPLANIR